jgi:hypothetical protein
MLAPFARLQVGLQTVAELVKEIGHQHVGDFVSHRREVASQATHALRCPAERRVGISRRRWLDQRLEVHEQRGGLLGRAFPAPARPSRTPRIQNLSRLELSDPSRDRRARHARRFLDQRDTAVPYLSRLASRPQSTAPLRQLQFQGPVLPA